MAPWMVIPGDWRRPAVAEVYSLYWCRDCGFGQIDPRPARDQIASYYDVASYYTHENPQPGVKNHDASLLDRLRIKLAWKRDQGSDLDDAWWRKRFGAKVSICDLGCGNGEILDRVRRLGHAGVGVEPDPEARNAAIRRGLNVLAGTAEDLPGEMRNERFDCVVMTHVLEHTLDPRQALLNAAGLLNDRGILVVETPNNQARGLTRSGVVWPWLDVPRHLNFFTSRSLQAICQASGLDVREVQYRGYTRQFDANWIGTEATIREVFSSRPSAPAKLPGPNRMANAWGLLLSTAWSPPESKYDSVRVVTVKKARS